MLRTSETHFRTVIPTCRATPPYRESTVCTPCMHRGMVTASAAARYHPMGVAASACPIPEPRDGAQGPWRQAACASSRGGVLATCRYCSRSCFAIKTLGTRHRRFCTSTISCAGPGEAAAYRSGSRQARAPRARAPVSVPANPCRGAGRGAHGDQQQEVARDERPRRLLTVRATAAPGGGRRGFFCQSCSLGIRRDHAPHRQHHNRPAAAHSLGEGRDASSAPPLVRPCRARRPTSTAYECSACRSRGPLPRSSKPPTCCAQRCEPAASLLRVQGGPAVSKRGAFRQLGPDGSARHSPQAKAALLLHVMTKYVQAVPKWNCQGNVRGTRAAQAPSPRSTRAVEPCFRSLPFTSVSRLSSSGGPSLPPGADERTHARKNQVWMLKKTYRCTFNVWLAPGTRCTIPWATQPSLLSASVLWARPRIAGPHLKGQVVEAAATQQ
eukprot:scaffold7849_cov457-Prasinococcus_capsulatus_cf.AAC.7